MDLSYENNKGLHAFFLALVMILGIFTVFAPVSTYAATGSTPTTDFKVFKLKQKTNVALTKDSWYWLPNPGLRLVKTSTSEDYFKYLTGVKVFNVTTGKDITSSFTTETVERTYTKSVDLKFIGSTSIPFNTEIELTYTFSKAVPPNFFDQATYADKDQLISSDFFKTAPMPPAVIQAKEVQELPTVLGKVAGIVTLVGCLIFAVLLATGSVRRFLSLFLR